MKLNKSGFTTEKRKPINFLGILLFQCSLYITIIFDIPIARQAIGLFYLTFIPGLVLIRLLKLDELDTIETILFSVGLSIAFTMLIGLFINDLFPSFGIPQPLLLTPTIITQSTIVLIAAILSCMTNRENHQPSLSLRTLSAFALSIPLIVLGAFGIITLNATKNNLALLILILLISLAFIIGAISKKTNSKSYPLLLLVTCFSLLFFVNNDTALVTNHITGKGDQWMEYQAFQLTSTNYYWNSALPPSPYVDVLFPTYSMLSVTILPTIFSQIPQVGQSWTFKIIYPLILSFMALGTYKLYTTQTNSKIAFLATFFFITISTGKGWGSAKQMIAQLFYVLLFILLFNKKIAPSKKKVLFVIFSFALATSHYALSYIFTFIIISFLLLTIIIQYVKGHPLLTNQSKTLLSITIIHLIIVFSWSIYINASESFNLLLDSINTVIRSINEFFEPQSRGTALQGLGVVQTPTILHQISAALFLLTEFFIFIGFINLIIKRKQTNFDQNYTLISALNMAIIAMNLLLPKLADTFLMSRFYQTTLIILAPVGILGGQTLIENIPKINLKKLSTLILALTILTPLFLFQTGVIYEIAKVRNESLPLSMYRWDDIQLHDYIIEAEEASGAIWLTKYTVTSNIFVHSDIVSKFQVLTAYGTIERGRILLLSNRTAPILNNNEFIYLGYTSIINDKIKTQLPDIGYCILNTTDISSIFENQNKVYSNGKCDIYKGPMPKP